MFREYPLDSLAHLGNGQELRPFSQVTPLKTRYWLEALYAEKLDIKQNCGVAAAGDALTSLIQQIIAVGDDFPLL